MKCYVVISYEGRRFWYANSPDEAREQHYLRFPDDDIASVYEVESI